MGQVVQRDGAAVDLPGAGAEVDLAVPRVGVVQAVCVLHAPCRRDGVCQRGERALAFSPSASDRLWAACSM